MVRRRTLAHTVSEGQTHLPVKFHGINLQAIPAAARRKSGRFLHRPQQACSTAAIADFCTAVLMWVRPRRMLMILALTQTGDVAAIQTMFHEY